MFDYDKDGELWDAVVSWCHSMGVKLPTKEPAWFHRDSAASNPTFYCAEGVSVHVLAFKRAQDDEWAITSILLKRTADND
jgi:hypothetical protein